MMRSGLTKGKVSGAPVGEKFESIDLVEDAGSGSGTDLVLEMIRDNQGAGIGFQRWARFDDADGLATLRQHAAAYKPAADPPTTRIS